MADTKLIFDILTKARGATDVKKLGAAMDDLGKSSDKLDKITKGLALTGLASAAAPVAGLLLAGAGAATVGAAAFGTLKLATAGVGEAFTALASGDAKKIATAMDDLSPSAAAFALEGHQVAQAWGEVQASVQEAMFAPLAGDLQQLSGIYLPALSAELPKVAAAFGQAGDGIADWASSADTVDHVRQIVAGTAPVVADLGRSVENLGGFFTTLGAAAMPVTQQLAGMIERLTAGMAGWAAQAEASGQLDQVFARTGTSVQLLEQGVGELGVALAALFANPATIDAANTLLQVLTTGTGIVANLATAFAALPDGLQTFVLIAAAAAAAGSKLSGAYQALTVEADKTENAQNRVAGAMNKVGRAATVAGGALTALTVLGAAATALDKAFRDAAPSTEALVAGLQKINETGRGNAATMQTLGAQFKQFGNDSRWLTAGGWTEAGRAISNVSQSLREMVGIDIDFLGPWDNAKKRIDEVDQALAQMVASGDAAGAEQLFNQLASAAEKQGVSTSKLRGELDAYKNALDAAPPAAQQLTLAEQQAVVQTDLLGSSFDQANQKAGGLKQALDALNAGALTLEQTATAYQAALDAMNTSTVTASAGIDMNTEAGRKNRESIVAMITAAQQYAAQANLTAPQIEALRQEIIAQGTAAGISRVDMEQMVGSLFKVGGQSDYAKGRVETLRGAIELLKDKQVKIAQSGAPDAQAKVKALQAQIDALKDKTVQVIVQTKGLNAIGGYAGYRWGGIRKMAKGGIRAAASGLLNGPHIAAGEAIRYGEPATGGELYLPRHGNRARSRALATVAVEDWLGGKITWPDSGGGTSSGGSVAQPRGGGSAAVGAGSSGGGIDRAVLAEMRSMVRAIESMGVYLDNRRVGSVQGREADLYSRAG